MTHTGHMTRYFTPRPPAVAAEQWTGDNFPAIAAFATDHCGATAVDNGNGTINVSGLTGAGSDLPVGTWLVSTHVSAVTEDVFASIYAELAGEAPRAFVLESGS